MKNKQCRSFYLFDGQRCQGATKHTSHHWCYNSAGFLCQWRSSKGLKMHEWAVSITPPGHRNYIEPLEMMKKHYLFGERKNETL